MKRLFFVLATITLLLSAMRGYAQTDQAAEAPTTLEGWAERVQKFGKGIPQEQVFIHMDNTCYFLGDTIYFKAYVRRSDTGAPSRLSGLLYAELFNQDGYLVERQLIELKNGQGDGSFCLLDTLYGGYYELRAYTRWQLNWGQTEHSHTNFGEKWFFNKKMAKDYFRDYEKLYSRVFPVYNKPKTPGDFQQNMTLRPLRRRVKADTDPQDVIPQLYPEGGHLVAGVENCVAFEANDEEGIHVDGTLTIVDHSGNKVAEGITENRGRGTVLFTPVEGEKYKALFTLKQNTTLLKAKEGKCPEVETDGCAIRVERNGDKLSIGIAAKGTAASEKLGLTVMSQGVLQGFQELGSGGIHSLDLNTASMPIGILQLTVFNAQGRIYADRLVFNTPSMTNMGGHKLSFTGIQKTPYEPFAAIDLGIEGGEPGSIVSVAVRDAAHTEYIYDNGNILTEMLLSSQIRGFVENPGYFFEKDDDEHRRALDLMLMVQGWRRFDWHIMATPGEFTVQYMPEHTQMMSGEINTYMAFQRETEFEKQINADIAKQMQTEEEKEAMKADNSHKQNTASTIHVGDGVTGVADVVEQMNENSAIAEKAFNKGGDIQSTVVVNDRFNFGKTTLKREVLTHAEFVKPGAPEGVVGEMMSEKGHFNIESPRFYGGCYFFLGASDTTKWKKDKEYNWVTNGEDSKQQVVYPEFYVKLNPLFPRFVKPYNGYQKNVAEAPEGSALSEEWMEGVDRTLRQVTVGAKRTTYTNFDASKPAFVIDAYDAFNDVCDAGLCNGVFMGAERFITDIARNYIGDMNMERPYEIKMRRNSRPENFHISDGTKEKFNHLANLDKVYIYTDYSPRLEGDRSFEQSNQPIVEVDLRLDPNDAVQTTYRDRFYVLKGYAVCEDFYHPDYSKKPLDGFKDYRRTLFWDPNVQLDNQGNAKLHLFNNGKKTQIAISAEGMSEDGTLSTGLSMPENQ